MHIAAFLWGFCFGIAGSNLTKMAQDYKSSHMCFTCKFRKVHQWGANFTTQNLFGMQAHRALINIKPWVKKKTWFIESYMYDVCTGDCYDGCNSFSDWTLFQLNCCDCNITASNNYLCGIEGAYLRSNNCAVKVQQDRTVQREKKCTLHMSLCILVLTFLSIPAAWILGAQ